MLRTLRRSQLVSYFGVGAMIDFPDGVTLMTAGIDSWYKFIDNNDIEPFRVVEERLQEQLGVAEFRLPPDSASFGRPKSLRHLRIPLYTFPRWHYCAHCGVMKFLPLCSEPHRCTGRRYTGGENCATLPASRREVMRAMRIVAVCARHGHIQDFPFLEWVHRSKGHTDSCEMRFLVGDHTTNLSSLRITCSCGESRDLKDIHTPGVLAQMDIRCSGHRPWLGPNYNPSTCGDELIAIERGASNVYFPATIDAIFLPQAAQGETEFEVAMKSRIGQRLLYDADTDSDGFVRDCELICETNGISSLRYASFLQFARESVLARNESLARGNDEGDSIGRTRAEGALRKPEFHVLSAGISEDAKQLQCQKIDIDRYGTPLDEIFAGITLVHKLRATRVFTGFTRYRPPSTPTDADSRALSFRAVDWLPAIVVHGEGLFLEIRPDLLAGWSSLPPVIQRTEAIREVAQRTGSLSPIALSSARIALHTFAHILINQFATESGYGSSSLRERIYCDTSRANEMYGILIYTAAGDSAGTLGGLVRQGKPDRLVNTVVRALDHARWCSYDPVCIETNSPTHNSLTLAACHGCALLPETSCECNNQYLDRAMLIGLPHEPELGLFSAILDEQLAVYTSE